jgi:hypothetical protein
MNALELLNLTSEEKTKGIWLYGIEGEDKYRNWYENGQLAIRCFYDDKPRKPTFFRGRMRGL